MQKKQEFPAGRYNIYLMILWMGRKIENIPCKNESEVEHYYFRMGIHLFLGYALGATDLHGENIIAHGEYPVIIDMETYPGYLKQQSEKKTEVV